MYVDASLRNDLKLASKRFEEAKEAFEELKETLEVIADKKLIAGISASEADYRTGKFHNLDELKA
jgi:hypothetical protein